jgi:hypothetical protein
MLLHANRCELRDDGRNAEADLKGLKTKRDEKKKWERMMKSEREKREKEREKEEDVRSRQEEGEGGAGERRGRDDICILCTPPPEFSLCPPSPPRSCSPSPSLDTLLDFPLQKPSEQLIGHQQQQEMSVALQSQRESTLHQQKQQVASELRSFLLDIYSRHGLYHPVFHQPQMTLQFLQYLFCENL